mgnify:CR=1 FL=1
MILLLSALPISKHSKVVKKDHYERMLKTTIDFLERLRWWQRLFDQ